MVTQQRQAPSGQPLAEVIGASARRSKIASMKRVQNEQWERRIEEDWQGHMKILRQCISQLLVGNQQLRMKPIEAGKPGQE